MSSPLALAQAYADACLTNDAVAMATSLQAIRASASASQDLEDALEVVAADPTRAAAVRGLASRIQLSVPSPPVGNALALGSHSKAVSIGSAQAVYLDGKESLQGKARVLYTYLEGLQSALGRLPSFAKLARKGGDARPGAGEAPQLAKVYVGLEVEEPQPVVVFDRKQDRKDVGMMREVRRIPVLRQIAQNRQLVILGEPGSGKSTLGRHLCWAIAGGDEECLKDWPVKTRPTLPFLINLRDLARVLSAEDELSGEQQAANRRVDLLWQFMEADWGKCRLTGMKSLLEDALADKGSSAPLFFFDGLDEVRPDLRQRVARVIQAWSARYLHSRSVITCRVRSYRSDSPWNLHFPVCELLPFTLDVQVPLFVQGWFAELVATGWVNKPSGDLAADLLRAVQERSELKLLAPSPLLLTMMSLVHGRDERLPSGKALLYNRLVDLLLWEWEDAKERESDHPASLGLAALLLQTGSTYRPAATEVEVKRALAGLVFQQMQAWVADGRRRDQVDSLLIAEKDLRAALMPLHPGCEEQQRVWAGQVVELIHQRSGLLMEMDDDQFGFPHKTLAEFLCAFWLCEYQPEKENAFSHFSSSLAVWDDWREVGLLAAGFMARNAKGDQVLPWFQRLVPVTELKKEKDASTLLIIAAEMLLEVGQRAATTVPSGLALWQRTQAALRQIVQKGWLPAPQRARVGCCLGWMGDDRPGVLDFTGIEKVDGGFWSAQISPGPFLMGNDTAHGGFDDERPRHSCSVITLPYAISRHLITVAQYALFVQAGGYLERRWWSGPGWKWVQEEKITAPETYGSLFDTPNHPQTGVCWYEVAAFSSWLADHAGLPIRLPSEAEWERSARHTDARPYPWGEKQPEKHANIDATGIGSPSAVGLFPSGKAECGALDLSGNVWEWTASPWSENYSKPAYDKLSDGKHACVLRGGAYLNSASNARCARRLRYGPHFRDLDVGFRLVVSPF